MTLKFASVWDKVLNFNLETTVKANCFTIMLKFIFWSCFLWQCFIFFKFSRQKKWSQKECTISFCLQHRNSSWKGNCALHFSNRRQKRSCPLKLGRMGVQVSMVGLDMLSFLIFNRWKLLPVVESAALLLQFQILRKLSHDPVATAMPSSVTPKQLTRLSWPARTPALSAFSVSHTLQLKSSYPARSRRPLLENATEVMPQMMLSWE